MPKIFISYRRDDSAYVAHQIKDALGDRLGHENIIFDVESIPLGIDFRTYLNQQITQCDVLLAIIGDEWLGTLVDRQAQKKDFVSFEIETALQRNIPVIPVLVDKATMPEESQLPPNLASLAYRNAIEIRAGMDFRMHIERLVNALDALLGISNARANGAIATQSPPAKQRRTDPEHNATNKTESVAPIRVPDTAISRSGNTKKSGLGKWLMIAAILMIGGAIAYRFTPMRSQPAVSSSNNAKALLEVRKLLAKANRLSGDQAKAIYLRVLQLDPDNKVALKALGRETGIRDRLPRQ